MKNSWIGSPAQIAGAVLVLSYMVPAPIRAAQNVYAGCLVAPDDSIFNTPINTLPVHTDSAAWIAQSLSIGSVGISFGEAWSVNLVDNSVIPTAMTFHYTTQKNGSLYPLLTGNNRTRETGSYTTDGNNDHHMVTLNRQTCHWYETYQDNLTGSVVPAPVPYAASGWDYLGTSYTQPTNGTADAAGLPIMPLTVHLSEMQAGAIHHAMRFTSCAGCISHVALWPATGSTAYSASSAPMGSRWRLKASYDDSKLSPKARIITTALKTYGMILADMGGISQVQIDQDINLDPSASEAFNEVGSAHITQDMFEIVDESGLMISPNSHQAKGVAPTSVPVLVGTTSPVIFPQSGTNYQLPSWVNGTSDQNVLWSLVSGPGTVSSAGVYTAPTGITTPVSFVLKGVAEVDFGNPVFVSGYVMPAGTMRINAGNVWAYTDTKGNNWLADNFGVLAGSFTNNNDTWPPNLWAGVATPPDGRTIFGWSKYTWGDDIQYGPFIVPNGTYSVQFEMAVSCTGGSNYSEQQIFNNGLTRGGTVGLEANGAMTLFSIGGAINDACLTPAMPIIQTVVTNNVLRIALRSTSVGNTQEAPFLNALIITPEAAPQIVLNPANLNFGDQQIGTTGATQTVTIKNSGTAALTNSIMVSNSANFSASSNCPARILPNTSCTVAVTFKPTQLGPQSAILALTTNAAIAPQPIPITGIGSGSAHPPSFKHLGYRNMGSPEAATSFLSAHAHFVTAKAGMPQNSVGNETKNLSKGSVISSLELSNHPLCVRVFCPSDPRISAVTPVKDFQSTANIGAIPQSTVRLHDIALSSSLMYSPDVVFFGIGRPSKHPGIQGFFLLGAKVVVGSEGEWITNRYLVSEITPDNATIEDVQTHKTHTLPISSAVK